MANTRDLQPNDVVIAVLGPAGSGKSTFINSASGRNAQEVGHSLKPCTSQVQPVRFLEPESGRHVVLVDTPGFDNLSQFDSDILSTISRWRTSSYGKHKLLSGILYLHRITDNRMPGTPLKNLTVFKELCGEDALTRLYFTTTMWDDIDPVVGEQRLNELRSKCWKPVLRNEITHCGGSYDPKKVIRDIVSKEGHGTQLPPQERQSSFSKGFRCFFCWG